MKEIALFVLMYSVNVYKNNIFVVIIVIFISIPYPVIEYDI